MFEDLDSQADGRLIPLKSLTKLVGAQASNFKGISIKFDYSSLQTKTRCVAPHLLKVKTVHIGST